MIMMNEKKMEYIDVLNNINEHFNIYIYLKKISSIDKGIKRYISSVVEVDNNGNKKEIYKDDLKSKKYSKISKFLLNLINNNPNNIKLRRFTSNE